MVKLVLNARSSIFIIIVLSLLILSTEFIALDKQVDASNSANLTPYKWGIKPGDILSFSYKMLLDEQDLLRAAGHRKPLIVVVRVDAVQEFPDGYYYDEGESPSAKWSITEYRIDNAVYSEEKLFERLPLLTIAQTELITAPLALPTDFLDYLATQFLSGKTERTAFGEGITLETKVIYTATYLRYEHQMRYSYVNVIYSVFLEFSRLDGIMNEYETFSSHYFDEGVAENYGIAPGAHLIKRRMERLQVQRAGYSHSKTPGFAVLFAILSFCLYSMLKKRGKYLSKRCQAPPL